MCPIIIIKTQNTEKNIFITFFRAKEAYVAFGRCGFTPCTILQQ